MDVHFKARAMQKACASEKQMRRHWGDRVAPVLRRRLAELEAAQSLEDLRRLPGPRCHELTGQRDGELAVDLVHPQRLVFRPDNDPRSTLDDGGLDWACVTSVVILGVVDYH